jgi:hypothetical protein
MRTKLASDHAVCDPGVGEGTSEERVAANDELRTARINDAPKPFPDLQFSLGPMYRVVAYGRFCKSAGGAGSWYAGDVESPEDAHHAPKQA